MIRHCWACVQHIFVCKLAEICLCIPMPTQTMLLEMLSLRRLDEKDAHVGLSAGSRWIAASSNIEHFSNYHIHLLQSL